MVNWINKGHDTWSLSLGRGFITANVNRRLSTPNGYDVWVNGNKIGWSIDRSHGQQIAIEYIQLYLPLVIIDMEELVSQI